jgi:YYY domain-containing protein
MTEAFVWWLAIEAIGAIAFPIAFVALRFLPDRGYSFAKIFGLVLMSYLLWLGGTAHIIPNRRWSILLILVLMGLTSAVLAYRRRFQIRDFFRQRWHHLLFGEVLFSSVFVLALFLRSPVADIFFNTNDNIFNAAFLNATLRTDYFPPEDPWLAGHSISYYYFGFVMVAGLTKLTGIASSITFHLAIALLAALAASGAFGVIYNLLIDRGKQGWVLACGALAGIFLVFLGNIEGLFELLAAHGVGSHGFYETINIYGLDGPGQSSEWYPTEGGWPNRAAFFADGRFDSVFPFFDLLLPVGYLTARNMALPIVLLVLSAIVNLWRSDEPPFQRIRWADGPALGLTALALGALIATHAWDFPTALLLTLVTGAICTYRLAGRLDLAALARTATAVAAMALLAVLLYLPYFANASSQFGGILTLPDSVASKPHHLIYLWLPLFWMAASLALASLRKLRYTDPRLYIAAAVPVLVLLSWAAFRWIDVSPSQLWDDIDSRGYRWITVGILATLLVLTLVPLLKQVQVLPSEGTEKTTAFPLVLSAVSVLLILGVEFFYVNEATGGWFLDLTTVLRVNYQAWLLLSLAGAFAIYHIGTTWSAPRILPRLAKAAWATATVIVLAAGFIFPLTAGFYFSEVFAAIPDRGHHLDGLYLLKRNQPGEYAAIRYLKDEVDGTPVILEAVTDSYRSGGRVSAFTGLPTVLGWTTHEFWFRDSMDPQAGREEDVELAYTTMDPDTAQTILDKYHVEYVYFGRLERELYGEAGMAKFSSFMDVALQNAEVTIFSMRSDIRQRAISSGGDGAGPP